MLLPVPHHVQTHRKTCLPACAMMVMGFQGVTTTESELAEYFETQEEGTRLDHVLRLNSLPTVESAALDQLDFESLHSLLTVGVPPIVYLWTAALSNWHVATIHAVVVVGSDGNNVYVNDPYFDDAPHAIPREEFEQAWDAVDRWSAVIRCQQP